MRYVAGEHRGTVLCDQVVLPDVVEVDTALGFAVVYDRNKDGRLYIGSDGDAAKRLVLGKMQFIETIDDPQE